jgi:hypothetical protein
MSDDEQPTLRDGGRYAAGLPHVGRRALGDHERSCIRRRLRRLELEAIASLAGLVGIAVAAGSNAPMLEPHIVATLGGTVGVMLSVTGAIGLVVCLCTGRRVWRTAGALGVSLLLIAAGLEATMTVSPAPTVAIWFVVFALVVLGNGTLCMAGWQHARVLVRRRRVQEDLADGWVEQFEGRVTAVVDETLRHLRDRGDLRPNGSAPHRLELLPRSGLLLRIDGRPLRRLAAAYMAEIAPAQPHAFRARLPAGLVPHEERSRLAVDLRRRSLTPAERAEIAAHIRRLRRGISPVVAVTLVVVVVTGAQLLQGLRWDALTEGVSLAWYALAAIAWAGYVRRILAARKLEHDRTLRWVVTVHDAVTTDADPTPPKLEVLPISQLAWTENAAPAMWRVSRI